MLSTHKMLLKYEQDNVCIELNDKMTNYSRYQKLNNNAQKLIKKLNNQKFKSND